MRHLGRLNLVVGRHRAATIGGIRMVLRAMTRGLVCGLPLIIAGGCAHWTTMREVPVPAAAVVVSPASRAPLTIESVTGTLNGTSTAEKNPVFLQSYAAGMRESGLFYPVFEPAVMHQAPEGALRMKIQFTETVDLHQGAAFFKGIFIGLSWFLLAPVLPLDKDLEQIIDVSLTFPDGQIRRYQAETIARTNYHFFANYKLADIELNSIVGTSNLQAIIARLREDPGLHAFLTPLPEE